MHSSRDHIERVQDIKAGTELVVLPTANCLHMPSAETLKRCEREIVVCAGDQSLVTLCVFLL